MDANEIVTETSSLLGDGGIVGTAAMYVHQKINTME